MEVAVVRKDGFDGEIELAMEDLPPGVSACGLKIPASKNRGMMLITAAEDAPRSMEVARLVGRAQINGATVSHPCRVASMTWPVKDATQEIPKPRLLADRAGFRQRRGACARSRSHRSKIKSGKPPLAKNSASR